MNPEQVSLGYNTVFATDIEDLYVKWDHLALHLPEMHELNGEADLDLLLSIKFVAHNTGRRLSQLEGRMAGNGCSFRQIFSDEWIPVLLRFLCHGGPYHAVCRCRIQRSQGKL